MIFLAYFVKDKGRGKKMTFLVVFCYKGGVGRNMKELLGFFINKVFVGVFQYDFRPPKHVLHLVWSVLGISTAIKTALKVAL